MPIAHKSDMPCSIHIKPMIDFLTKETLENCAIMYTAPGLYLLAYGKNIIAQAALSGVWQDNGGKGDKYEITLYKNWAKSPDSVKAVTCFMRQYGVDPENYIAPNNAEGYDIRFTIWRMVYSKVVDYEETLYNVWEVI